MTRTSGEALKVPVVLLGWKRPELTRAIFEAIKAYRPSKLYFICDGPRSVDEELLTNEVREISEEIDWECDFVDLFSSVHLGLRQRVMSGLSEVFVREDFAIVLEDDCLPNKDFFRMAEYFSRSPSSRDFSLFGGTYQGFLKFRCGFYSSFHYKIWGWVGTKTAWNTFMKNPNLSREGSIFKSYRKEISSRTGLLQRQNLRKQLKGASARDAWALDFYLSQLLFGKPALYPMVNLVSNIGFGGDSTHTRFENWAEILPTRPLSGVPSRSFSPEVSRLVTELEFASKFARFIFWPLIHPAAALNRIRKYLAAL